ncbi:MAG: hypothetical protein HKO65_14605, partial [Gemmatimonadetes bacterium]|nr:hypothetical protein [Gemmatimonadota bacterium]
MRSRPFFRSPLSVLAFAALAAIAIVIGSRRPELTDLDPENPADCEGLSPEDCRALRTTEPASDPTGSGEVSLSASEVCLDVGYLCAEVEASGSLRLLRWPLETALIRVRVPEPTGVPSPLARDLQTAAVRGIRAWNGHPFPLSVRTRPAGEEPDITIEWQRTVEEGRLGRAEVRWSRFGPEIELQVVEFTMATHGPGGNA